MYYRQFYITDYANETLPEAQLQQVEHIIVTVKKSKKCFFPYRENQWNLLNEVPEEPVEWERHKLAAPGQLDRNGCKSKNSHLQEKISMKQKEMSRHRDLRIKLRYE